MIESSLNKLARIKETIQGSENAYGKIVLKHADKDVILKTIDEIVQDVEGIIAGEGLDNNPVAKSGKNEEKGQSNTTGGNKGGNKYMKLNIEYNYAVFFFPTKRHKRAHTYREIATLEVDVQEMSDEECPVAIIRKYSPDETGYDGEQREDHIFRFDGNTLFQRMYVPVELLHRKYKYKFSKSKDESAWNDDTSIVTRDDQEDRIQSILKDLSECVIIGGELWKKESCYEPGYWVIQQDDKILLSVDAFLMEESDQEDSFNALQFEEAKKYAEKLAEKTGLPLVMPERMHKERLIEVVMPEAIKMDPQKKAKESILAQKKDIEKYLDVIKGWNRDMSQMEQYQIVHLWYCLREAACVAEGGAT